MIPAPVETQLKAIFDRDAHADCVAIVWPEATVNCNSINISGQAVKLVYCVSELAMREALVQHDGRTRLVLLSRFDESHLAKDVIARVWKNEPQRISPWKTLQQLINVRQIDPRLLKKTERWMAEALLNCFDRYSREVSFGEVLDFDGAWKALAVGYLGYQETSPDLDALFRWSLSPDVPRLLDHLPDDVKTNISGWLSLGSPKAAPVIEAIFNAGHASDLLAVSLVCSMIYEEGVSLSDLIESSYLYAGQGRFVERYLSGKKINIDVLRLLGSEASRTASNMIQQQGVAAMDKIGGKTEQIVASLDLMPLCVNSTLLPQGYVLRLELFAHALEEALVSKSVDKAELALAEVKKHVQASFPKSREQIDNSQMAIRLVRWLSDQHTDTNTAEACLSGYVLNGGFVDWARSRIWSGDMNEALSNVFHQLSDAVTAKRQSQNQAFSRFIPAFARGDALPENYLPVESVLDKLVAPIAAESPVLLLVLDGMSEAVYRELTEDILKHNWVELTQEGIRQDTCVVAAFPTVTQVSRCSLLSGVLSQGDSANEKSAFKAHSALKQTSSTKYPPELFHKKDIQKSGSGALDSQVREKLAGTQHRVLGLVINGIDDQLSSSSQVSVDWNLDNLRLLGHVLEAAKEAGRIVIITSDHGHVLDHDSFYQQSQHENGERYQLASNSLSDNEINVSGKRVVTEDASVVMPWSEQLRYTKSKNMGYHGGTSLQEVVIPLGIFANPSDKPLLDGWTETPKYTPDWWDVDNAVSSYVAAKLAEETIVMPKKTRGKVNKQAVSEKMDDMFSSTQTAEPIQLGDSVLLIDKLLASSVYRQQLQTAGRTNIKSEQLTAFISLMIESQGQAMESSVCKGLNIPKIRLRGFLAGIQKTLNVDGYPIVSVDRESQTIRLNIDDLKKQFEI